MSILRPKNLGEVWWDRTLTLVSGCTHVSAGCDHCWSRAMSHRFHRDWTPRFRADEIKRYEEVGDGPPRRKNNFFKPVD